MLIQEGSLEVVFDSDFEIDPELPQRQIDHFKDRLADARHRDMLENFRSHMYQEMIGLDLDALMNTMVPDPELRYYGIDMAPDIGYAAVRSHYERSLASRSAHGVTINLNRLMVDDEAIYFDGLAIFSLDYVREVYSIEYQTEALAVVAAHVAVLLPYRHDRIVYEAQYFDGDLGPSDLVILDPKT
jgi:hypothetical protein